MNYFIKKHKEKIISAILSVVLVLMIFSQCTNTVPTERIIYTVKAGDTLWGIAEEYKPRGVDIREYIYNIKKINALETSEIYSGMKIEIVTEKGEN